jgi:hypothetical protein
VTVGCLQSIDRNVIITYHPIQLDLDDGWDVKKVAKCTKNAHIGEAEECEVVQGGNMLPTCNLSSLQVEMCEEGRVVEQKGSWSNE